MPERGGLGEARGLEAFLRDQVAAPVRLDASAVQRLDTLLLQYLLAAGRAWSRRGLGFEVTGVGAALGAELALVGLTPDLLAWQRGAA
ncbi:STAS domain-containing protein [Paracoccaceae bacterium Fryx2]|nr:STAS domain-containing protein [Paracoccaceae bacterium Fryx2]